MVTNNAVVSRVELVYDRDCPNVAGCRAALRAALTTLGMPAVWKEWERSSPGMAAGYRSFGSPTVLVDARDIHTGAQNGDAAGNSCRVYADEVSGELSGFPSVSPIVKALLAADPGVNHAVPRPAIF
jgi:hypothetical protein